jgi:hypothetical protein
VKSQVHTFFAFIFAVFFFSSRRIYVTSHDFEG